MPDGSWAYRTTRFFPAYPNYDWGLLSAWAWGASRIVDYLVTDPSIDKNKLIITGVSRTGKSALIAGAFDDRFAMVAPVASSGGGTPAYRYSGSVPDRGGKEGLTEMVRKYPNWFSPHLHQFWGQPDKLPFDEHWLLALVAPRPLICLEGDHDQNVNQKGVYQSWLAARPAYAFLHATDKLGVSWADRPHGMVQGDWDALLAFADKFLLGKPVDRTFDQFPPGIRSERFSGEREIDECDGTEEVGETHEAIWTGEMAGRWDLDWWRFCCCCRHPGLNHQLRRQTTIWRFDNIDSIDGHPTHMLGHPHLIDSPYGKAIEFNGVDDALFVGVHPLAGARIYTWEVIFRPDADGAQAPRFFHLSELDPVTGRDTQNRHALRDSHCEGAMVPRQFCVLQRLGAHAAELQRSASARAVVSRDGGVRRQDAAELRRQ